MARPRAAPAVTLLLLAALLLVQLYVFALPAPAAQEVYRRFAFQTAALRTGGGLEGIFTYMFLHAGWVHLLVNLVALWGAGSIVEAEIGSARYALIYLASGVMAALAHAIARGPSSAPLVGASGAIFGVMAVLFLLMPFKITFALFIPLPAVLVGILLGVVEVSSLLFSESTVVAHEAHLGGFLLGGASAFAIDARRALRGLLVAVAAVIVLYSLGVYLGVF